MSTDDVAAVKACNELADRHESQEAEDGKREVKYAFAFKSLDWEKYHRHRPVYPESMWNMWFDYHSDHGGSFDAAHDLGAGPGTAAAILATRFAHVFVSDAGAANLAAAAAGLHPPDRFSFHHAPAEQVAAWLPRASVDFACVAMAFHYMDAGAAVRAVAETLKPGGTLAAVTYGFRLVFPGNERVERLWFEVASGETTRLIREGRVFPAAVRGLARGMAGLDFVGLPGELYEGVRRVYVNVGEGEERPFAFVRPDPGVWEEAPCEVAEGEGREFVVDEAWGREADKEWLREFLASCQLGFGETTWATEGWRELEAIVDAAPGGKVAVRWPVAMLLATRRREGS